MRVGFVCLLVLLQATAQDLSSAGQQRATFKSSTTLLTLDVTAVDRDGKPVAGLQPGDFEIKINGSAQPVQTLAFIEIAGNAAAPRPAEPSIPGVSPRRTAVNAALPNQSRVFVVVVDDLSFEAGAGKALFVSAENFVSRLPASDFAGFALTSGSLSINPTRDRRPVLEALKRAVGAFSNPATVIDPPMVGIGEAFEIEDGLQSKAKDIMLRECFDPKLAQTLMRMTVDRLRSSSDCADRVFDRARNIVAQVKVNRRRQLDALESVFLSLKGAEGIKYVVLLSGGLPVTRAVNDLLPVAKAAARSGVQLATMVEEGDIHLGDRPSGAEGAPPNPGRAQLRRDDDRVLLGGAQTMTDMAGGQFYRVIGQPHRFFDRVTTSASAVYRLGIALPDGTKPGQDLSISADVRRSGVLVLASHHAAAPEPEVTLPPAERMAAAIKRGETLYGVPISLGAIVRRGNAAGQIEIGTVIRVPGSIYGPLEAIVGVLDGKGELKSGKRTVPASNGDYAITTALPVSEGPYQLRVAIADSRGNVGAVSMPIDASLHVVGDLQTSDLLTWVPYSAGRMQLIATDDLPAGVKSLTGMLELYPRSGTPPDLSVKFALVDASGGTIDEKTANLTPGAAMVRADAQFAVDSLPPGRYALRADVLIDGRTIGSLLTGIRR